MELPPWAQLPTFRSASGSNNQYKHHHGRPLENSPSSNPTTVTKQKKKKKPSSRLADRIRPHGRIRTQNTEVYMKINLQDLEAYTQDVLMEERARRRTCWLRFGGAAILLSLMVLGITVLINYHRNNNTSKSQLRGINHNNDKIVLHPEDHPLASCEVQLNHSQTFSQLAHDLRSVGDNTESQRGNNRWCQSRVRKISNIFLLQISCLSGSHPFLLYVFFCIYVFSQLFFLYMVNEYIFVYTVRFRPVTG